MLQPYPPTPVSVGTALHHYQGSQPKDAQSIRSIIKKLYPEAEDMGLGPFQSFLNRLPMEDLKKMVAPDGTGWTPAIAETMRARLPESDTYFKAYPRFVRRFVDFASAAGMLPEAPKGLLPEWEDFVDKASVLLPKDKAQLASLVAAGVRTVLDKYVVDVQDLKATNIKLQNVRSAMRTLARRASEADLTPRAFAEEVLAGERQDELKPLAGQSIYYSYCRCLWNATVVNYPELDLPLWGDRRRQIGIKMEEWERSLREGVMAAVFERPGMGPLKPLTIKNYRDRLCAIVGILEQAGFELRPLVADLQPRDAVRLLFQGWPRDLLAGDSEADSALAIYRRLLREPGFRDDVLSRMRSQDGQLASFALVENPFIGAVLAERYTKAKYASAESMLDRVYSINNDYLAQRGENLKWLKDRFDQVNALMADSETEYDEKKQVVFKNPRLFERLIARAHELYGGVDGLFKARGSHWATFVRDLTYFTLAVLYPLRVQNHQLMGLDTNYDRSNHALAFKKAEVKNKKPIDFALPRHGPLSWVRDLVDLYLDEARPILLRGAESNYFFVGNHQAPNAKGHLQRQAFNDILIDLTAKHLSDLVPAEMGHLNPHLFRHIAATYQIVVRHDRNMAARLLNDSIATIEKHYADILGSSRQSCQAFFEGFEHPVTAGH